VDESVSAVEGVSSRTGHQRHPATTITVSLDTLGHESYALRSAARSWVFIRSYWAQRNHRYVRTPLGGSCLRLVQTRHQYICQVAHKRTQCLSGMTSRRSVFSGSFYISTKTLQHRVCSASLASCLGECSCLGRRPLTPHFHKLILLRVHLHRRDGGSGS
jgi:hypothetical protein